jgi:hypothetical protein
MACSFWGLVQLILHLGMDQWYAPQVNMFAIWVSQLINSTAVGVFQEYYQSTLLKDYSSSAVSWIPSLQFFFMMALVCHELPCDNERQG